jgi:hypothetical protein
MQLVSTHSHAHRRTCSLASFQLERDLAKHPDLPNRAGLQKLFEHLLRVGHVQLQKLPASVGSCRHCKTDIAANSR